MTKQLWSDFVKWRQCAWVQKIVILYRYLFVSNGWVMVTSVYKYKNIYTTIYICTCIYIIYHFGDISYRYSIRWRQTTGNERNQFVLYIHIYGYISYKCRKSKNICKYLFLCSFNYSCSTRVAQKYSSLKSWKTKRHWRACVGELLNWKSKV